MTPSQPLALALVVLWLTSCGGGRSIESFEPALCRSLVELYGLTSRPAAPLESPENEEAVKRIEDAESALSNLSNEMSDAGLDAEARKVGELASALTPLASAMAEAESNETYLAIADAVRDVARPYTVIAETFGSGCMDTERLPFVTP